MSGDITGHRVNQMDGKKRKRASLSTEQYEAVLHIISKHDCVSKAERMSARKPKHVVSSSGLVSCSSQLPINLLKRLKGRHLRATLHKSKILFCRSVWEEHRIHNRLSVKGQFDQITKKNPPKTIFCHFSQVMVLGTLTAEGIKTNKYLNNYW